jgi:class 3 adenylate cyclase
MFDIKRRTTENARAMIEAALEVVSKLKGVHFDPPPRGVEPQELRLRFGVHIGTVLGGVCLKGGGG